jgi:hypothetical protein
MGKLAHQDLGQGAFSTPVWPHNGMHFAGMNREVDPFQNHLSINSCRQILDF